MIAYGGQPITDQPEASTLTEESEDMAEETKPRRRGARRARGFGIVLLVAMLVPAAVAAILFAAFSGGPVVFPEWARDRVERTLDQQLSAVDVTLSDVSLVIEENWDPRIRVGGLVMRPKEGGSGIRFEQVDMRLAMEPLIERQIAPRHVRVSGVSLRVLRRNDGTVNVTLGQEGGEGLGGDASIATLGGEIEAFMARPGFRFLTLFEIEDVNVRYEDVLSGRAWNIDGGSIALRRSGDEISISSTMSLLGGRSYATTLQGSLVTYYGSQAVQLSVQFDDAPSEELATQMAALSWLEVLRAPISGAMRAEIDDQGNLGAINATISAVDGFLQPSEDVRPIPFESLRSYLTYNAETRRIGFDELSVKADWIEASVSGHALLEDFVGGFPNALVAQLTLNRFAANPEQLEGGAVALDTSFADFRLRLDPFSLTLGQLVVNQGDMQMYLSGSLDAREKWQFALDGHMNAVRPERVLAIWPEQFKPKLRIWIDENVHQAELNNVNLALRSREDATPDVYADFQFRDAVVKAVKTMPPIEGGRGFAVATDNKFHVGVERGYITPEQGGTVDVSGSSFVVLDTRLKQSPGQADVKAVGSIEAAASLLNRAPLHVFDKANLPVDIAQGRVEAKGRLNFTMKPKLPPEEVAFDVSGKLLLVDSTKLIEGKRLQGDLRLTATNEAVEIFGPGSVGDVPVTASWRSKLGKPGQGGPGESQVVGRMMLNQAALDEFEVDLPPRTVSGDAPADFQVLLKSGSAPSLKMTSDLIGLEVAAQPLGWRKPAATEGELKLEMTLGERPSVDLISLTAPGLTAAGTVSLLENGELGVVDIPDFRVGRWLSGAVRLRGRGKGVMPAVELRSGRFDMRYMPDFGGRGGGQAQGGPITGTLDRVTITESIVVQSTRVSLDTQGGLSGTFEGALGGRAPMFGTLTPHPNGTAVEVTSPNAGSVVQTMGLVAKAEKGDLRLNLTPRGPKGVYDGVLNIANIKIQNLPAFAELLNAVSVVGLLEQLNGPGLLFNEVYSKFKMAPGQIVIGEASAVGASMGVSADGLFYTEQNALDIQGVLSPIYAVNVIGRPISKRGEGLIGFNYQLKGPAKNPEIFVNPLSALTPGFFREIFRRPPPDLSN
ncbi:uncharacterized protein DUF3971 [Shimia isoporae]|uniref:Uncharacterized protein DUF3971 n=1 Tax=Shimia isoporae TaxID=647720 RepID=A0A4R1NLQ3_9RHOB|nr:DUF3971 domain-containing protein [Shimia isoporae]TCL09204.1 uncharacterized protein DUF3971 [Shimia isoporae]